MGCWLTQLASQWQGSRLVLLRANGCNSLTHSLWNLVDAANAVTAVPGAPPRTHRLMCCFVMPLLPTGS